MRNKGRCLHTGERFSLASRHVAYGGVLFASVDALAEWTAENKEQSEIDTVAEEYEIRNQNVDFSNPNRT